MSIASKRVCAAAVTALTLAAGAASAQTVLYTTDFNAPTYSANPLIGQDGWAITGTSVVSPITVNAGGAVPLVTTGQDVNRTFTAQLASAGGSMALTADINLSAAQATGDYFIHLGDGGTSNFYARVYARSSGAGYQLALATSSGTAGLVWGTVLNFGTVYNIVARYDFVSGTGNDTGALFLNPTTPYGAGDTAYVAATFTGVDATTISSVNLRQGTANIAPTVVVDNISVAYIPTPGAAALLGLGGLVAAKRRR